MDREGRFDNWKLYFGDLDSALSRVGYCERPVGKFQWAGYGYRGRSGIGIHRFVFDFSGGPSDEVLIISRVYYPF